MNSASRSPGRCESPHPADGRTFGALDAQTRCVQSPAPDLAERRHHDRVRDPTSTGDHRGPHRRARAAANRVKDHLGAGAGRASEQLIARTSCHAGRLDDLIMRDEGEAREIPIPRLTAVGDDVL
jgi:hypothetical protein